MLCETVDQLGATVGYSTSGVINWRAEVPLTGVPVVARTATSSAVEVRKFSTSNHHWSIETLFEGSSSCSMIVLVGVKVLANLEVLAKAARFDIDFDIRRI